MGLKKELKMEYWQGELMLAHSQSTYFNTSMCRALSWAAGGESSFVVITTLDGEHIATITHDQTFGSIKQMGPKRSGDVRS
jgi:hypothetical protein